MTPTIHVQVLAHNLTTENGKTRFFLSETLNFIPNGEFTDPGHFPLLKKNLVITSLPWDRFILTRRTCRLQRSWSEMSTRLRIKTALKHK